MNNLAHTTFGPLTLVERATSERQGDYTVKYEWSCERFGIVHEGWVSYSGDYSLNNAEAQRKLRALIEASKA